VLENTLTPPPATNQHANSPSHPKLNTTRTPGDVTGESQPSKLFIYAPKSAKRNKFVFIFFCRNFFCIACILHREIYNSSVFRHSLPFLPVPVSLWLWSCVVLLFGRYHQMLLIAGRPPSSYTLLSLLVISFSFSFSCRCCTRCICYHVQVQHSIYSR
jgi:hypothetical protein